MTQQHDSAGVLKPTSQPALLAWLITFFPGTSLDNFVCTNIIGLEARGRPNNDFTTTLEIIDHTHTDQSLTLHQQAIKATRFYLLAKQNRESSECFRSIAKRRQDVFTTTKYAAPALLPAIIQVYFHGL